MARKKQPIRKAPSALDVITQDSARVFAQSDGRVITRARDVLMYEHAALEEHLAGLRASTAEVQSKKARVEAKIAGLTAVLAKR